MATHDTVSMQRPKMSLSVLNTTEKVGRFPLVGDLPKPITSKNNKDDPVYLTAFKSVISRV
jgi:hypothetical protein